MKNLTGQYISARMPDRDKLINESSVVNDILAEGKLIHSANLRSKMTEMGELAFVETYYDAVNQFDKSLLNDLTFIPRQMLARPDRNGILDINDNCGNYPSTSLTSPVYRTQVESGVVLLSSDECVHEESTMHWFLLQHTNMNILLTDELPKGHWALPYLTDIFQENIQVRTINPGKTAYFGGAWVCENIKLCDAIHLKIESLGIEAIVRDDALFNRGEECILVPAKCTYPGSVVCQISSYTNEYDELQDGYREQDDSDLNALVSRMRTNNPAKLLENIINQECGLKNKAYDELKSRSFNITVNKNGEVSIRNIKNPKNSRRLKKCGSFEKRVD